MRRLLAALTLGGGVLLIGRLVVPSIPREVEVRVGLSEYREPPRQARALRVELQREGATVRAFEARFGTGSPPGEYRATVSLAPGGYHAVVSLELEGQVLTRESEVNAEAERPLRLPVPVPP